MAKRPEWARYNSSEGLFEALLRLAHVETVHGRYEAAHRALAQCNDLLPQSSSVMPILYNLRLAFLLQFQAKTRDALHILESLLEDPQLLPFVHLRHLALFYMAPAYVARGQLSRALRALNLSADSAVTEDHTVKAQLALHIAGIYILQSLLSNALSSLRRAQNWLLEIHYKGVMMAEFHLINGVYALACGDTDNAQVEFKIVLEELGESATFNNAHIARIRIALIELCRQRPASCLALIESVERFPLSPDITLGCQLLRADRCLFIQELGQAMVHTILSLVMAKNISDDSRISAGLQRLGDIFLMDDKDCSSANACYQVTMDVMKRAGVRRHVADCVLRFGIIHLLEGKIPEAKQKLMNSRRIYKLADDSQGHSYCEAILAECEVEGPKVSLTATAWSETYY